MPAPIIPRPVHLGADPCGVGDQLTRRGGRQVKLGRAVRVGRSHARVPLRLRGREIGPGQAGVFGPDQQVVREHDEAQKGVELPRAQVLDVVDVARGAEERFDGRAVVVERERWPRVQVAGRLV